MLESVHVEAPAKINLSLKVGAKRSDGYHDIESIFQQVSLYDSLDVSAAETKGCTVSCEGMVLPPRNTLSMAYDGYAAETGIDCGVHVRLVKRIPSGAGLGGGSSDAAAFICALDALFGTNLSPSRRKAIALSVGSDVAFFLAGTCALVSGRGDEVLPLAARHDLYCLLVCPDVHSSTAEAYALFDAEWNTEDVFLPFAELERMYRYPVKDWRFINSFTVPVTKRYPVIAQAIADVEQSGASFVQMTGSGSAVFGIFELEENVKMAYTRLGQKWEHCYVVDVL
ncbi:MAG: 4-(cytidine 5'-diphospho)-2-C-methyl-D-erythritol kinase [Bacteroides sp.]|nr:4-(cytidine 5'-diphospho)-2-C-methyl-D-erythritol kinase [Prevotella sp.]MCM1408348.1 4-(cytidine 5'-diphospho)-2-C-methyl-D-erythritol kinase [Treponema brennaborense]MCM1470421.1 4-(cytidine 5'-diphospho)-2-C-methyl-D-erythritol kinase [Bacteroides sp.]